MGDERSFGERVADQVDADLELATRTRLPEEDREMALAIRAQACEFGDLSQKAVDEVALPLMIVVGGTGYQHGVDLRMFGPLGGSPLQKVTEIASQYGGGIEERGRLLGEAVAAGLAGQFVFEGEGSIADRFGVYWPAMQDVLGNERRLDKPARSLFEFGAAMYAVETTILLEMIREERHTRALATIEEDERRGKRRLWRR